MVRLSWRQLGLVEPAVVSRLWLGLSLATVALVAAAVVLGGNSGSAAHTLALYGLVVPAGIPVWVGWVMPRMLGARGIAFPRLHRLAFDLQLAATGLLAASIWMPATDDVDASWNFFTAASGPVPGLEVDLRIVGALFMAISTQLVALNVVASVHGLRAPSMRWRDVSPGTVAVYVRALVASVAAPVAVAALVLLLLERHLGLGLFYGVLGGDPLMFQHLFWFALHPLLVSSVLPALGFALDALNSGAARPLGATPAQRLALAGAGALSLLAWGQHMHGASPVHTMTVSLYALLAVLPVTFLIGQAVPVSAHGARSTRALVALTTLLVAAIAAREWLAAVPSVSIGLDVQLFGGVGIPLFAWTVLAGLLVGLMPIARRRTPAVV